MPKRKQSFESGMVLIKSIVILITLLTLDCPAESWAAPKNTKPNIPPTHWASREARDLLRQGWMREFPDGTFRGNDPLMRNDAALLFSKEYENLFPPYAIREKIGAEVARESADIGWLLNEMKKIWKTESHIELSVRSVRGASASHIQSLWRGQHAIHWNPNEDRHIKFSLDTLDAPYTGGLTRSLFTELIDLEWKEKFFFRGGELAASFSAGPDKVIHTPPTAGFDHEVDRVFVRRTLGLGIDFPFLGWPARSQFRLIRPMSTGFGTLRTLSLSSQFGKEGILSDIALHLLPRGTKFEFGLLQRSLGPLELAVRVWSGGTTPNETAYHLGIETKGSTPDRLSFSFTQAGSRFRKETGEELEWLPYSPFGRQASDSRTQIVLEWQRHIGDVELSWNAEWLLTNQFRLAAESPGTSQTHHITLHWPATEKIHWQFSLLFFDNPSQISWRGTPLSSSTNTVVAVSLHLDNP